MFKEYILFKLSIGVLFLTLVLYQWNKDIQNSANLFTDKISYDSNDEIRVISENPTPITIKNVSNQIAFSGFSKDVVENLSGGLYIINDKFPLVVKSDVVKPLTIVFPYVNNLLLTNIGNGSLIELPQDSLSLNTPSYVDELDRNLFSLVEDMNLSYNVISDFDLENDSIWTKSNCVIIYGKSKFYTEKMSVKLLDYMNDGGNVLMLTSSFAFYKIKIDANKKQVIKVRNDLKEFERNRNKIPVYETYGGIATSSTLTFNAIENNREMSITTSHWCNFSQNENTFKFTPIASIPINGKNKTKAELGKIENTNSISGSTFLIGSEEVLLDVNMQNQEWRNYLKEVLAKLIEQ